MDIIGFPKALLAQSVEDRISYFKGYTLVHPHLEQAYENLSHSIKYASPGSLIFLYGPSGVGKTTLIQKIYKNIFDAAYDELIKNPVKLPAIFVRAIAADNVTFDWKDYFRRLLIASNDFISDRLTKNKHWQQISLQNKNLLQKYTSSAALKAASEISLKYRNPFVVFLDEAQEIGAVASGRKLIRQTNVLKSVAEETKITHVLSGTYDLLSLRNLNGQLSRRSIEVHFPRYDAHNKSHRTIFRAVLRTFQLHLPFEKMPDLVTHWEYIFERCVGCIGTLKDWLTRAMAWSLEKKSKTLTLTDLKKREPSIAQSIRTLEEVLEGENYLKHELNNLELLRSGLGLNLSDSALSE